jgi:aspartyl-tRNA(Asn)/glutamyl-tRNA(Gln) amidotransferase subunit A
MPRLVELPLARMRAGLDAGEFSSEDLTRAHLDRIREIDATLHAFLHVDEDGALAQARRFDAGRRAGGSQAPVAPLAGIPIALKDILCTSDMPTTCGSRLLEGYVPPYDATAVLRLRRGGAVLLGKTNMDEFAMGSSCENSGFGPTRNPFAPDRVPGGSSGGSAAAVASFEAAGAYGTDTGGSIRQPASLCGLVGMKPTYGRVSRLGLVAFASSLDQIGPMARTVEDAAMLLQAIWGHDAADATSSPRPVQPLPADGDLSGLVFGVPEEAFGSGLDAGVGAVVRAAIERVGRAGGRIESVRLPNLETAIPTYYLIATAEASANLARFDGIRYGRRRGGPDAGLLEAYEASRSDGFGTEVRRRIMLGTYALSAGYYDAYYLRAQKVRTLIRRDFSSAFAGVDLILTPTSPTVAFRIGERVDDPLAMYLSDIYTVPANLAGLPALSLPCGVSAGLPVGMQVIGDLFREDQVVRAARGIERTLALPPFRPALGRPSPDRE